MDLLSPLTWLVVAFVLVALIGWRPSPIRPLRWLRGGALTLGMASLIAMTPLVANTLLGLLEYPPARPAWCQTKPPAWAVVLAGGSSRVPNNERDDEILELATRRRLDGGITWWKQASGRRLVLSGGRIGPAPIADSVIMASYAERQGVPRADLITEEHSKTTWENAKFLATLTPAIPKEVVLLTSASHMPRAIYSMQQAGFDVCPVPTDSRRVPLSFPGLLIPQASAMIKSEAALHELVGMAYYHWLAWQETR